MAIRQELGNIAAIEVDAVVNAANSRLLAGSGVCGAIYHAAGLSELQNEVEDTYPDGCPTGGAVITSGHGLPARHIIHAVGPVWQGGDKGENGLLASAYRSSLELAVENNLHSIAFPSISTGIYGFPLHEASEIAVEVAREFEKRHPEIEIVFCAFNQETFNLYRALLNS